MLEIRNFKWLSPFRKLFDLKDVQTEKWTLQQTVVPTISLDENWVPNHKKLTLDLTGSAGTFVSGYAVGQDEVVRVRNWYKAATTANSAIAISDGTNTMQVSSTGTAASAASDITILLRKGWFFGMLATGNPADSAIELNVRMEIQTQKLERGSSVAYPGDLDGGVF